MTFEGHNILSVLLTFRTFTAELSGIAAVCTPGIRCVLTSVLPHRRWPSGRVETLGIYQYPRESDSMRGAYFAASNERLLSLRPSGSLAILTDRTGVEPCSRQAHDGFLHPSSQVQGHPHTRGICYGAKPRIAPAGLSPASSAARLAARPPGCSPPCPTGPIQLRVFRKTDGDSGDFARIT